MTFISDKDLVKLKDRFKRELKNQVTITLFTQQTFGLTIPGRECRYCDDTQRLMEELTSLSPKLHLEIRNFYSQAQDAREAGVERIPAIVMSSNGASTTQRSNVKFYGIPLGLEFPIVLEDLITLSRGVSTLSLETRKKLKQIKENVHIQVFAAPTGPHCPQVARMAHAMAMENPHIVADVVGVQEFPDLAQRYMITGVPKTVINERVQFVGAVPESLFADKVLEAVGITSDEMTQPSLVVTQELGPSTRPSHQA